MATTNQRSNSNRKRFEKKAVYRQGKETYHSDKSPLSEKKMMPDGRQPLKMKKHW